jgi:hypothetical protein
MSSVLGIALTYFRILSLQRWLNLAGLVLLTCGAVLFVTGGLLEVHGNAREVTKPMFVCFVLGVTLIMIVPGFGGGIAMRMGSTPAVLHLKPHGRLRMLLGSALAVILLSLLVTLPALAAHWFVVVHDLDSALGYPEPWEMFLGFLPLAAGGWALMFLLSRSAVGIAFFWLLPLAVVKLMNTDRPWILGLRFEHLVMAGVAAWVVFALSYLRARSIRRPAASAGNFSNDGVGQPPFQWLLNADTSGAPARPLAISHYLLGCGSMRLYVLTGAWVALIFLLLHLIMPRGSNAQGGPLLAMLPYLSFQCAITGFTTARRARLLWLRAGLNRAEIFALASRLGLQATMITWAVPAAVVALQVGLSDPGRTPNALLFVASQAAVAVCMFYGGLSLVRDWSARDVLLCIALVILFIAQAVMLGPQRPGNYIAMWSGLLAGAAVLALLLRAYAAHLWRVLDWRLIKPPKMDWRQRG